MTTNNKAVVLRLWYDELWDKWNLSAADELFSDDYRLHLPGVPTALDRQATKQVVAMFSASFPDLKHTVDEMIAEGATRWLPGGPSEARIEASSRGLPHPGSRSLCQGIRSTISKTANSARRGSRSTTWNCSNSSARCL